MEQVKQDRSPANESRNGDLELPSQLEVACYRFTLEAIDPLDLPPYVGSTLRGGFGSLFRRIACVQRHVSDCKECLLYFQCPYVYIFDTPVPQDAEVLRKHDKTVRPFVIQAPRDQKTHYAPGDTLTFGLTLVGRAIQYLSYCVVVFEKLGEQGLGRRRGKYTLKRVQAVHPYTGSRETVYATGQNMQRKSTALAREDVLTQASRLSGDHLGVQFLTPTRLKSEGQLLRQGPPFHVLLRTLLGRVSSLSYFHCGQRWETDFRAWIDRAREVQLAGPGTGWVDWGRYSGRQRQRVRMGGLVGRAAYEGELRPYLPLLALGELVHVGKGTVFGNGQYVVNG